MKMTGIARLVIASVLCLPAAAWAQSSITGVVRDSSGAVLPGVTIEAASPALIDGSRTAVSDSQGLYRIVDLLHGGPEAQPYIDGMNQQLPNSTQGVVVFNQLGIQEVVLETSGIGADRDSGGMTINMVPRDGGNTFSGVATFAFSGPSLEASANRTIELIPARSVFEARLQQVDLRFSRLFRLGGTRRIRGNLDVYNLLNAGNVLNMNTTYGPAWKDVLQILSGRLLRVGAQFDF